MAGADDIVERMREMAHKMETHGLTAERCIMSTEARKRFEQSDIVQAAMRDTVPSGPDDPQLPEGAFAVWEGMALEHKPDVPAGWYIRARRGATIGFGGPSEYFRGKSTTAIVIP